MDPFGKHENTTCPSHVTYSHREDDPGYYNWCVVPNSGYDAILFAGVALLAACLLQGKFSALWIMAAGAVCQTVAFPVNLGRFGNSLAIWLGIRPADILLYTFLPPMLLDASVRVNFFLFQKVLLHVVSFAFLLVMASTVILTPILLFLFNLRSEGWQWPDAALFAVMLASTDAVAVSALLKSAGAPEHLVVILEGESLFNDATSIVLFQVVFGAVQNISDHKPAFEGSVLEQIGGVTSKILRLAAGGALVGYAFGIATRLLLKLMHRRGHKAPEQLALTLSLSYLCFYCANAPLEVSGVIAVVVYGLSGCSTAKWHMSAKIVETGIFDSFWDTVGFSINGVVFFFAGASSVNFFWRSSAELLLQEPDRALIYSFWRLPFLWVVMFAVRGACILALNPLFSLAGTGFSTAEIVFSAIGGLRGAISLILAQVVVTEHRPGSHNSRVIAQLVLWTAGVVVLTLAINAPIIPPLINRLGLLTVAPVKARMRAKAARALMRHSHHAVHELQQDQDEMLRGVDWRGVEKQVDLTDALVHLLPGRPQDPEAAVQQAEKDSAGTGPLKSVMQGIRHAAKGDMGRARSVLEPLLERHSSDMDQHMHEYRLDIEEADAASSANVQQRREAPEKAKKGDDGLDELEVPFLSDKRKAKPKDKDNKDGKLRQEQADEENPPRTSTASNRAPPSSSRSSREAPAEGFPPTLPSPFSREESQEVPVLSTASVKRSGSTAPSTGPGSPPATQPPQEGMHPVIVPCLVPAGGGKHRRGSPSVHWTSTNWQPLPAPDAVTSSQAANARRSLQRINSQRRPTASKSQQRRHGDTRALQRALSGMFTADTPSTTKGGNQSEDPEAEVEEEEEQFVFSQDEMVEEARLRLVAGLKRYYHAKRAEGLLSARGMQLLDWVCAAQMDAASQPLFLWSRIEREACGHMRVRVLSQLLFWGRKFALFLRTLRPRWLFLPILWPLARLLNVWSVDMSRVMLLTLEVAMEFWLSLQWTPQAQWLKDTDTPCNALKLEVREQSRAVWHFILDREVEAPARFCSIQTFRAALAVMTQQAGFVDQLYKTGMVDDGEHQILEEIVDRRARQLTRIGPGWKLPQGSDVLRGVPALQGLPESTFEYIVTHGRLVRYAPDQVIWQPPSSEAQGSTSGSFPCPGSGIFIVAVGLVKTTFSGPGQSPKEFFVGAGEVLMLLPALLNEGMVGVGPATAMGSALGHGPVVFHLPQDLIDELRARASSDLSLKQLELDLHRMAAMYVLGRTKPQLLKAAQAHYKHMALQRTRRAVMRRLGPVHERRLGRRPRAEEVWAGVRTSEAAQKVVARELEHALFKPQAALQSPGSWEDVQQDDQAREDAMADEEILSTMDPKDVAKALQLKAVDAGKELKEQLRDARLVVLGPWQQLAVCSSLVLLKGSLRTSGQACQQQEPGEQSRSEEEQAGDVRPQQQGDWHIKVQYRSPCVLPWLWEAVSQSGDVLLTPQPITHVAGQTGATIVICPPRSSDTAHDNGDDPESSAALDERVSREARDRGASSQDEGAADSAANDEEKGFAVLHGQVPAKRLASGGAAEAVEYDHAEGSRRGDGADVPSIVDAA
ncbi:hypothetical protein WJX73_003600 [Symbiochloris irregularis]|uniref:Cation/H+ exchanger transmembrane domain-containing protein n=1 Tax=Symbiochloris irregularis TaxID=706552 RepID=A0AAW1NP53_9CHLO